MTRAGGRDELFARRGGSAGPTLVLLHGLAANAEVWDGVIAIAQRRWAGRWIAPDLRGHGRSGTSPSYSYGGFAADVAGLIDRARPVTVLGHSMGGVVGLTLASGFFGVNVVAVIGVGIKVAWTEEEAHTMAALANRPSTVFASRADAVTRGLRLAGLQNLVADTSAAADASVVEESNGYRVAFDSAANGVGRPPMRQLLAAAQSRVTLACGESDPMVTVDQLEALSPDSVELAGMGHNAHVEDPEAVWQALVADSA